MEGSGCCGSGAGWVPEQLPEALTLFGVAWGGQGLSSMGEEKRQPLCCASTFRQRLPTGTSCQLPPSIDQFIAVGEHPPPSLGHPMLSSAVRLPPLPRWLPVGLPPKPSCGALQTNEEKRGKDGGPPYAQLWIPFTAVHRTHLRCTCTGKCLQRGTTQTRNGPH